MIIVTGGAGFIGSRLIKGLNDQGFESILVVDDLTDGKKFTNLVGKNIVDYMDKDDFAVMIEEADEEWVDNVEVIFHLGACSTTTEWNGKYMMENNYEYSKLLLQFSIAYQVPYIYASSAAVYGAGTTFKEAPEFEAPLNVYGYSKYQFDQYVRRILPHVESQVVGLRYFNVYGPGEFHKGSMASVAYHLNNQMHESGKVKLFEGCDGYGNGEQQRDFVYVDDVVAVNTWFWKNPDKNGIFNVGTGKSQTFNDVANAVVKWHGKGHVEYIPFPDHLKGHYQSFTEADLTLLQNAGYTEQFKTVEDGVKAYLDEIS